MGWNHQPDMVFLLGLIIFRVRTYHPPGLGGSIFFHISVDLLWWNLEFGLHPEIDMAPENSPGPKRKQKSIPTIHF